MKKQRKTTKKASKNLKSFSKRKRNKSNNMVPKDIKTFLNINNKGWLSIDAGCYKMW